MATYSSARRAECYSYVVAECWHAPCLVGRSSARHVRPIPLTVRSCHDATTGVVPAPRVLADPRSRRPPPRRCRPRRRRLHTTCIPPALPSNRPPPSSRRRRHRLPPPRHCRPRPRRPHCRYTAVALPLPPAPPDALPVLLSPSAPPATAASLRHGSRPGIHVAVPVDGAAVAAEGGPTPWPRVTAGDEAEHGPGFYQFWALLRLRAVTRSRLSRADGGATRARRGRTVHPPRSAEPRTRAWRN